MALYPSPNRKPQYQETKPRIQSRGGPSTIFSMGAGIALAAGLALSTGILAVNYATPSRDVARVAGATLGGKVSLAGISRSTGRSPGVTFSSQFAAAPSRSHGLAQPSAFKSLLTPAPSRAAARSPGATFTSQFAAAPSRAHGLAPGATLSAGVVNFNMGNGLSRAAGLTPGATVKSLIPAALSRSSGIAQPGTLKSLIPAALSRASSRTQPATLKSLIPSALSRSNGIAASAFLGGKVSLGSASRSNGRDTAQLSTHFPTTDIGGAISRDTGRAVSTGIILVGKATPSRDIAKAGPATLRFQGAGFDMGSGLSRAEGRALGPSLLKRVYYATPMRGAPRTFAAIQLHQETGPSRATGLARCLTTLGLQGQQPPTISRGMGGRVLSVHIKLYYATVPSLASGRALGTLQFSGGATTNLAGLSRASSKAHGLQLQTLSGPKIGVAGLSRSEGRARSASTPTLLTLYYVTPSKADPRASAWLHTHQETGPSRGMGGRSLATITSSLHINLQGLSRQSARVPGAFLTIRPQLVGVSLAESRALGTVGFNKLPVSAAPSRDVARTYSGVLEFLPITVVQIQGGISRASSRAVATIKTFYAAQPSIGSARTPGATLTSKQALTSTSRAAGLANAQLGFTGALVIALDGDSYATSRTFANLHISLAGGWIQGHGRAVGEPPSYQLALRGSSLGHPRAVAVLAFTGASVQPVAGSIRAHAQAVGLLRIITPSAPSMAHGLSLTSIELLVRLPLTGTSLAQALATGAFENPFASPISRAHGYTASGLLVSSLPLDGGISRDVGRLVAELTIPKELPELIFLAKSRVFVFKARGRVFVIAARDRRFIFPAGGHREQIC